MPPFTERSGDDDGRKETHDGKEEKRRLILPLAPLPLLVLPLPIFKHPRQVRIILAHLIKRSTAVSVTTKKDAVPALGEGEGGIGGLDGARVGGSIGGSGLGVWKGEVRCL